MLRKLLVDNAEGPFIVHVGLLYAHVEGIMVDRAAVRESHHAAADEYRAAEKPQFAPAVECTRHRAQLLRQVIFLSVTTVTDGSRAPLALQFKTLRYQFGRKLAVFVVGIQALELVDMVALALQFLARQVHEFIPFIYIIAVITFSLYIEHVRKMRLYYVAHVVAHAEHEERMPHGYGVVVHGADNLCRAFITRLYPHRAVRPLLWARYRGHICEMAAGVKAEHEIIVYYGKLGIIKKSPTYEVGERQVAVLPLAPKSKALYKGLVGYGNILELYHIGNMLDFISAKI